MPLRRALVLATVAVSLGCNSSSTPGQPGADAATDTKGPADAGHGDAAKPTKDASSHDAADAKIDGTPDAANEAQADVSTDGASDAPFDSLGPDGGWRAAPHDPLPQVVNYGGVGVASPVFTSITFSGYDLTTEAEAIVDGIGATAYWTSAVTEYGVGPATATAPIELTETAPATIDDPGVQTWLAAKLQGGDADAAFAAPTASTVYVIQYPSTTTVSLLGVPVCQHFGGYHNSLVLSSGPWSGLTVTYVVVGECDQGQGTAVALSEALAHELTAATTNPAPLTAPAYADVDQLDELWSLLAGGGEVPDLCAPFPDSVFIPTGYPYTLVRVWSDLNAAASHDPCQPAPSGEVYFNASPHMTDTTTVTAQGGFDQIRGVLTPLNTPKTIEVDLYSDGPTAPWTVAADDLSSTLGGGPYISFAWDATQGQNGTKLHLTVTALEASTYGGEPFEITSTLGTVTKRWYGFVAQN